MIITSDIHLVAADSDKYRWDLFPFLKMKGVKYKRQVLFILGDLTEFKDKHDAYLVNRIVEELVQLTHVFAHIYILKGNHDYIDEGAPFFGFLNYIPGITFIDEPTKLLIEDKKFLMLPHSFNPVEEWNKLTFGKKKLSDIFSMHDYIMMHQTVNGAVASNGQKMEGIKTSMFKKTKATVISGDIHVPQVIGGVEYVGSPYAIKYNDAFNPRVLYIDIVTGKKINLRLNTISKRTIVASCIEDIEEAEVNKGDMVKLKLRLKRSQLPEWMELKQKAKDILISKGASAVSVLLESSIKTRNRLNKNDSDTTVDIDNETEVLTRFSEAENLDKDFIKVGLTIVGKDT